MLPSVGSVVDFLNCWVSGYDPDITGRGQIRHSPPPSHVASMWYVSWHELRPWVDQVTHRIRVNLELKNDDLKAHNMYLKSPVQGWCPVVSSVTRIRLLHSVTVQQQADLVLLPLHSLAGKCHASMPRSHMCRLTVHEPWVSDGQWNHQSSSHEDM